MNLLVDLKYMLQSLFSHSKHADHVFLQQPPPLDIQGAMTRLVASTSLAIPP